MPVLNPTQMKALGVAPRPPGAAVKIAEKDGTPTAAWTNYLQQLFAWQERLTKILGT